MSGPVPLMMYMHTTYITMNRSTAEILVQRFGSPIVELTAICGDFFGMEEGQARRKAATNQLPVPTFRTGSQKSPWFVHIEDLEQLIDEQRAQAKRHHIGMAYAA